LPFSKTLLVAGAKRGGQDRARIVARGDCLVVVVADGAGGVVGAESAAELLVTEVERAALDAAFDVLTPAAWSALLARVDQALAGDARAGETTAVVVAVSARGVAGASTGDSGAWIVRRHDVDELTAGQPRKARLGSGAVEPVAFARSALDGTLLVASDGLFAYTTAARISARVRGGDLEAAVAGLVSLVRLPSGELMDDIAVALVRPGEL